MNSRVLLVIFLALFLHTEIAHAKGSSRGGKSSSSYSSSKSYSKKSPVKGIYTFKASNGKKYIGKSVDVARRIKQHIKSGKLNKSDLGTLKVTKYKNIPQKALSLFEKTRIRTNDIISKEGLANKQNAPFSRAKEKVAQNYLERKQKIKEKIGAMLKENQ